MILSRSLCVFVPLSPFPALLLFPARTNPVEVLQMLRYFIGGVGEAYANMQAVLRLFLQASAVADEKM